MITARPDSLQDRGQRSERSGHNEIDYNSLAKIQFRTVIWHFGRETVTH